MNILEAPFFFDENQFSRHLENEARAKNLSRQLLNAAGSLRRNADQDSYPRANKIYRKAETLYRYCCSMEDALEDSRQVIRNTNRQIADIIEDGTYTASRVVAANPVLADIRRLIED